MAIFPEMVQYIKYKEPQRLKQPKKLGWCARVCLDIAIVYALQKTILDLNVVNPNLTKKVIFNEGKPSEYKINVLNGGFTEEIYNLKSQWNNGGLFYFDERDLNSRVITVIDKNNLRTKPDGKVRLFPIFQEHKSGTISSKLSEMVEFVEETTPTTIGLSYQSLRVCFLQFVHINGMTRHECIVCGTNLLERVQKPNLTPTVDIYNPWGNVAHDVNPNYLCSDTISQRGGAFRKIFHLKETQPIVHKLETVRFFSFKWWK